MKKKYFPIIHDLTTLKSLQDELENSWKVDTSKRRVLLAVTRLPDLNELKTKQKNHQVPCFPHYKALWSTSNEWPI